MADKITAPVGNKVFKKLGWSIFAVCILIVLSWAIYSAKGQSRETVARMMGRPLPVQVESSPADVVTAWATLALLFSFGCYVHEKGRSGK